MVATYASGSNTYVPNHEASGSMVVNFSRNVNSFAVNRYCQIVPVTQDVGYYLSMTVEEAGRIVNTDLADFQWPDGADAPEDTDGSESFNFSEYRTKRVKFGFRLGQKSSKQATWDIIAQHGRIHAQKAMTARTLLAATALTTAANYDSTHTSAVASISGNTGTWAASTTARQDIKRSLNHAANVILKDTLGVVEPEDLHLVISPTLAANLAQSQEIVDHIKGSPDALAQIRGELPGRNAIFGLPNKLYGWELEIEKTVRVSTRKGITTAKDYVWPATSAALVARPGALTAPEGGPNFSTCVIFMYEEMTVEEKVDKDNRVTKGRVVEDYAVKMVAPVSGFLFTTAS